MCWLTVCLPPPTTAPRWYRRQNLGDVVKKWAAPHRKDSPIRLCNSYSHRISLKDRRGINVFHMQASIVNEQIHHVCFSTDICTAFGRFCCLWGWLRRDFSIHRVNRRALKNTHLLAVMPIQWLCKNPEIPLQCYCHTDIPVQWPYIWPWSILWKDLNIGLITWTLMIY